MTDDLHSIDDLFRGGIEGHAEDVPPSVWEAVSHDLDKKQASYYKTKYRRTKRAAVLLLLLCFLSAVYIVYKTTGEKKDASGRRNPPSAATVNTTSSGEKKSGRSPVLTEGSGPDKTLEQEKEAATTNDTAATSLRQQTAAEERQEPNGNATKGVVNAKNQRVTKSSVTTPASPSVVHRENEKTGPAERVAATTYGKAAPNRGPLNDGLSTPASSVYKPVLLPAKDYSAWGIDLKALAAHNRTILSQTASAAKSKTKTAHGFSLTAFAAPNLSFERLEDNDRLAGPGRNRQEAHREEEENYSFSAGLALSYNLTNRLSLQSGLSVTSSSIAVAPKTVYAKADNNGRTRYELHCSSGYAYINPKSGAPLTVGDSAQTSGTASKLTYVSVPAFISYRFSKGRFSLSPNLGAGLNFLTSGKTTTRLSNRAGSESATTAITGLKSTYADGYFGVGIDYDLSKKLSIGIRPNARLALTPINKETPVQSYQNFLSVETGLRIKL